MSAVIRHVRGVPERCPSCNSERLRQERGYHPAHPEIEWERPICTKCGWAGEPVPVAGSNYRQLRQRGHTVRKTIDCLIATFCLRGSHALLHSDRDFDSFEERLGLQVIHPQPSKRCATSSKRQDL